MSPFRTDPWQYPNRTKIQFTTSARMPNLIYQACLATGTLSNTVYCQYALIDALVRDLGLDRDSLVADLPAARGPSGHLYDPDQGTMNRYRRKKPPVTEDQTGGVLSTGPGNTVEDVR
jgi:hypothetical protein